MRGILTLLLCLCLLGSPLRPALAAEQDARGFVQACFEGSLGTVETALPDLLLQEVLSGTRAAEVSGQDGVEVTLPDFANASTAGLPAYEGQDPGAYMVAFVQAVAEQVALAPRAQPVLGALADAQTQQVLAEALLDMGEGFAAWLSGALSQAKAYGALTRLALDLGVEEEAWKQVAFADGAYAPFYAADSQYKTIKNGSKGDGVKRAQTALTDQGYLTGKVDGIFGSGTAAAVKAFEQAAGLAVDGELNDADLRVLYGEPAAFSLAQLALENGGLMEEASQWWTGYLASLSDIRWEGTTLIFAHTNYQGAQGSLAEKMIEGYNAGEFGIPCMPERILEKVAEQQGGTSTSYSKITLSLQPFLDGTAPAGIVGTAALNDLARGFEGYAQPVAGALEEAVTYAQAHLPPQPFPSTGVMMKPSSGDSKFIIRNGNSRPLYAKIYRVSSTTDLSTSDLVATAFVGAEGSASMKIKPGYYHVHYGTGDTWYGEEEMFGDSGFYNCCEESYQFMKGYEHTLLIQISDAEGEGTIYEPIDRGNM